MQFINGFHLNSADIKTCEHPIFFSNISGNIQKIVEIIFRPGGHMVVQEKQRSDGGIRLGLRCVHVWKRWEPERVHHVRESQAGDSISAPQQGHIC